MYDDTGDAQVNQRGQLVTTILPDATPNDDSDNLRTITLYDRGGRTRASINEVGQVSHSVYDSVGRMVATIVPDGTDTLTDLFALLKASTESLYPVWLRHAFGKRTAVIPQLDAAINSSDPMQHLAIIDWTQVVYPEAIDTAVPEDDYLTDNPRSRNESKRDERSQPLMPVVTVPNIPMTIPDVSSQKSEVRRWKRERWGDGVERGAIAPLREKSKNVKYWKPLCDKLIRFRHDKMLETRIEILMPDGHTNIEDIEVGD